MRSYQLVQSKFGGERDTVGQVAAKPISIMINYSRYTSPLSLMRVPCTCIIHGSRHRYTVCARTHRVRKVRAPRALFSAEIPAIEASPTPDC